MESKYGKQITRIIGESPDIKFTPGNTALLVVDLQYFDAHPDWGEGKTAQDLGVAHLFDAYYEQLDNIMPRVQTL